MKTYEPQSIPEVELGLDGWRTGEWPSRIIADQFSDPMMVGDHKVNGSVADEIRHLFEVWEVETLTILEMWVGYVQASEGEGAPISVEDFILATYEVLKDE